MLPFEPESSDVMQARYPAAVAPLYEQAAIVTHQQQPPSGFRQHVFDWPDGLRLIISRERTPEGQIVIHFSASVDPETSLDRDMRDRSVPANVRMTLFLEAAKKRWRILSRSAKPITFLGLSDGKGVPHFKVDEES